MKAFWIKLNNFTYVMNTHKGSFLNTQTPTGEGLAFQPDCWFNSKTGRWVIDISELPKEEEEK